MRSSVAQPSRRALLQGPAVPTAAPFPDGFGRARARHGWAGALAGRDFIARLSGELRALHVRLDAACDAVRGHGVDIEDAVCASFDPERHRIEDAIRDTPATDMRDLAVRVMVLSGDGCWGVPNALILECAHFAGRALATLPGCVIEYDMH